MLCATSSAAALIWLALAAHPGVRADRLMVCVSPALPRGASAIMPCSTYTDAGSSNPRAAVQHDQHCRSWSYLRALRESSLASAWVWHHMSCSRTLPRPAHLLATKGPTTGSQRVPLPSCSRLYVTSRVRPLIFLGCASTRSTCQQDEQWQCNVRCASSCRRAPRVLYSGPRKLYSFHQTSAAGAAYFEFFFLYGSLFNGACSLTGCQRGSTSARQRALKNQWPWWRSPSSSQGPPPRLSGQPTKKGRGTAAAGSCGNTSSTSVTGVAERT